MKTRVFIVDDHELFRAGLEDYLRRESQGAIEPIGSASSARAAFPLIERERPDVVILDLALPGMDGISAAREIRRRAPKTAILMLTAHEAVEDVLEAFAAGALGYVSKGSPPEELLTAIGCVAEGKRSVPEHLVEIVERHRQDRPNGVLQLLSEREREVFRLAMGGMTNSEIAQELCISRKTVETHRHRMHKKLGLRNATDLILFAATNGLLRGMRSTREAGDVTHG